jgi:acyl carrier protein
VTAVVSEDDVRRVFAETFKVPAEAVSPGTSPENVDAWDSFGHMRLVTAVEAQLSVRLTMEQILAIDSFAALCRTLGEARGV